MKVQLPSKRIVEIRRSGAKPIEDILYGDARALFSEMNIDEFPLADFHALRAIATHEGWLEEDEIEIACRNCDETIVVRPCAAMQLGPFFDAELDDEELDHTLDLSTAHDVPGLGAVRLVRITLHESEALHRELAKRELDVTAAVVTSMGIAAIDDERDPRAISRKINACDDRAFDALGNLFLAAHYPPRLFGLVLCPSCKTRNDVDAPYDREFAAMDESPPDLQGAFPTFDEFDALVRDVAEPLIAEASPPHPALVVDGGVPETDDGGEPLLGSYVPGEPGNPGEITIHHRSFAAMWNDHGAYDVQAEIEETIAHELEHHEAHFVGHDAMDDDERDEIAREARRVIGKKALARNATRAFAADIIEFGKRTWLVWIVVLIAVIIATLSAK